jgi:hypothetical protein
MKTMKFNRMISSNDEGFQNSNCPKLHDVIYGQSLTDPSRHFFASGIGFWSARLVFSAVELNWNDDRLVTLYSVLDFCLKFQLEMRHWVSIVELCQLT